MKTVDPDKVTGHVKLEYNIKVVEVLVLLGGEEPEDVLVRMQKAVVSDISLEIGGAVVDKNTVNKKDGESFEATVKMVSFDKEGE